MASLSVRLRDDLIVRLDQLAKSVRLTRSHIVRAALEYGLERFAEDPELLLRPEADSSPSAELEPFARRLSDAVQKLVQEHKTELLQAVAEEPVSVG